jgi:hypothetical protein
MKSYAEYFAYLDTLRESGATNMFGARPYIEAEFGLPKDEASRILSCWMQTFGRGDKTPAERAAMVPAALEQLGLD